MFLSTYKKRLLIFTTGLLVAGSLLPFTVFAQNTLDQDTCIIQGNDKFITMQTNIPGLTQTMEIEGKTVYAVKDFRCFAAGIYRYLAGVAGVLSAVMMMYGGVRYVFSMGSAQKFQEAQDTIVSAMVGLALTLGSYIILYTVNPALVTFERLNIPPVQRNLQDTLSWEGITFCEGEGSGPTTTAGGKVDCGGTYQRARQLPCTVVGSTCTQGATGVCLATKDLNSGQAGVGCWGTSSKPITLTYTKPGETESKVRSIVGDSGVPCGFIKDDCSEVFGSGVCLTGSRGIGTECGSESFGCVIMWDDGYDIYKESGQASGGIIGEFRNHHCY